MGFKPENEAEQMADAKFRLWKAALKELCDR
jgi:hypothetical protein